MARNTWSQISGPGAGNITPCNFSIRIHLFLDSNDSTKFEQVDPNLNFDIFVLNIHLQANKSYH